MTATQPETEEEWGNLSIVNNAFDDPMGSCYWPPRPDRPYWLDPNGNRVTVSEVWAGADNETRRLIYERSMKCFNAVYDLRHERSILEGTIFRGGLVESPGLLGSCVDSLLDGPQG